MMNKWQPDDRYPVPRNDTSGYGGDLEAVMKYEPELINAEPKMETEE